QNYRPRTTGARGGIGTIPRGRGDRQAEAPFSQYVDLWLWDMSTLSHDTDAGIGNCCASIRGRTASVSQKVWSKHLATSAVNGAKRGRHWWVSYSGCSSRHRQESLKRMQGP